MPSQSCNIFQPKDGIFHLTEILLWDRGSKRKTTHAPLLHWALSVCVLCQDQLTGLEMRIFTETDESMHQNYYPRGRRLKLHPQVFKMTQNSQSNTYTSSLLLSLLNKIVSHTFQAKLCPFSHPQQRMHIRVYLKDSLLAIGSRLPDSKNHYLLCLAFSQDPSFWI